MTVTLATYFMAAFTGLLVLVTYLLVRATRKYTSVTEKLLEQNKESFNQSRKALLADVVSRTVYRGTHMRFHSGTKNLFLPYIKGVYETVKAIDIDLAKELMLAWKSFSKAQPEEISNIYKDIEKVLKKDW